MTTRASKVTVDVACPYCAPIYGSMTLEARAVHLTIRSNGSGNTYEFVCPRCLMDVVKEAGHLITSMMFGRVPHTVVDVPVEAVDPARSGPSLTYDDLLDFVAELNQDNWVAAAEEDFETRTTHIGCVPFMERV